MVDYFSRAILKITEGDAIIQIEKKWIGDEHACKNDETIISPSSLDFKSFLGLFLVTGVASTSALLITLVMFLYKNMGLLNESIKIAHELDNSGLLSDCAAYNAVMACYVAKGNLRDCADLVQKMVEDSIFPDASTFQMIFSAVNKINISSEEVLQLESAYSDGRSSAKHAILAFLFSMAGMHAAALNVCEQLPKPELTIDPCAYNVAFKVYASCGEVDKAFSLFMRMHALGLKPDTVTCIDLSTCYGISGMSEGMRRISGLLAYRNSEFSKSLHKALVSYRETGSNEFAAQLVNK